MSSIIALDVGTKRIGVAIADTTVPIATPLTTVIVDGQEQEAIQKIIRDHSITKVVVGYPRNQLGNATEQTAVSETFGRTLSATVDIVYQDESLTSVMAEERLKATGKSYTKADIDAYAATIILQDYLETQYA